MYKFTNGVVVYDEKTRDNYIKAGMILVKEEKPKVKEEKQVGEENNGSKSKFDEFEGARKRPDKIAKRFR